MLRPKDSVAPGGVERTLVARTDAAGDVLLAEPAIRSLGSLGPVTLLTSSQGEPAARLIADVDDVIVFDGPWTGGDHSALSGGALRREVARVAEEISRRRPGRGVILTSARQSPHPTALLLRMAGVPSIAARSHDFLGLLADVWLPSDPHVHEVERNLQLAYAAGGAELADSRLQVRIPELPSHLSGLPDRFVVVHPGASVPARTLSVDRWRDAIDALAAIGLRVVLTGAATDAAALALRHRPSVSVDLVGSTTLGELAAVLAAAEVVCVGNTGPMHLAAAVGTPIVAAFPPTVPPERWRPWMTPHVLLGDHGIACAECHVRACPFLGHPCADVTPDQVVEAAEQLTAIGASCR